MAHYSLAEIRLSKPVVSGGDVVYVDLAIQNIDASGRAITGLQLWLFADGDAYGNFIVGSARLDGLSIAKGKTESLRLQVEVDLERDSSTTAKAFFDANPACRALDLFAALSVWDSEIATSRNIRGLGKLLNKRYHPAVSLFDAERAANGSADDEGLNLLTTAKLTASDGEAALLQARLYYVKNGSPDFQLPVRCVYPGSPMTANSSQGCEVSASSVYGDENAAFHAMDGADDQAWFSSQNATAPWIQLKMPRALYDMVITLVNQQASPAKGPVSGVVYGVEENGTLVQIGAFSGRDGETAGAQTVIACSNTARGYDTVRLKISSWNGSSYAAVGEMRISGYDLPLSQMPECIDLTSSLPAMLAGVEESASLVTQGFSNGSGWCMMLWFGDEYESDRAYCTIDRAFANMHLSGKRSGGVCFGGFSASAEGKPLLESYYPAHFHGGIARLGDDWLPLVPLAGSTPAAYGGGSLRCRAVENRRIIAGSLLVQPGSSTIALAQLPENFKPASSVFSLNACSGSRIARLAVHGDGDEFPGQLALSWVWDMAGGKKYTSDAIWVQCGIEYWVGGDAGSGAAAGSILGQAILGEMILGGD